MGSLRLLFGGMLAHAPFFMASSLIRRHSHGRQATLIRTSDGRAVFLLVERRGPRRGSTPTVRANHCYQHCVDFARQAAARPSHRLALVPCDAGAMLMHADNRGVDHLDRGIMGSRKCVYDSTPDASPPPPNESVVASGVRTEGRAKVLRNAKPRRCR